LAFVTLQAVAKHIYETLRKSSVVVSNLIGPVEPMVLANHPVKGLYFTMTGGPEVNTILVSLLFYGHNPVLKVDDKSMGKLTII